MFSHISPYSSSTESCSLLMHKMFWLWNKTSFWDITVRLMNCMVRCGWTWQYSKIFWPLNLSHWDNTILPRQPLSASNFKGPRKGKNIAWKKESSHDKAIYLGKYLISYRVLHVLHSAGFLPSTACLKYYFSRSPKCLGFAILNTGKQ